jgi:predicted Fe-Mo cluster-binding NifX family protein
MDPVVQHAGVPLMKIAMPVCENRVSTVFDAADELLLIETGPGDAQKRSRAAWKEETPMGRTTRIRELGVQVLICGALSGAAARMMEAAGIWVIPFVRGTVDEVLGAFFSENLTGKRFFLPGCALSGETG